MKLKKMLVGICVIATIGAFGVTAFGETTTGEVSGATPPTRPAFSEDFAKRAPRELTEEQKAEMEARKAEFEAKKVKMDAMQEKWSALTDAQKEEIYTLKDKTADINTQIVDKYLQWGVIDQETADEMKTQINERKTDMRQDGRMPLFGRGGPGKKLGRPDFKGAIQAPANAN